jgi:hypothetical protein
MKRSCPMIGVLAACASLALVLGACGGDDDADSAVATTSTTVPPVIAPLTGLEVDAEAATRLDRSALVVKIDNVDSASRPQAGLVEADVVFEEKVEGPYTRFAAVLHSTDADQLGPIRSGRSTDLAIMGPLGTPLFAYSGANAVTLEQIRAAPIRDVGADVAPSAYERLADRRAPDNLFSNSKVLWDVVAEDEQSTPSALFSYRSADESAPPWAMPVVGVTYAFGSGAAQVEHRWDPEMGGWVRTQGGTAHVDIAGRAIAPQNLIVQFVDYIDTGLVDAAGTPVPEAVLIGSGAAWVFVDGDIIEATWDRSAAAEPTRYSSSGEQVHLVPGRTWVILLPVDGPAEVIEHDSGPETNPTEQTP